MDGGETEPPTGEERTLGRARLDPINEAARE